MRETVYLVVVDNSQDERTSPGWTADDGTFGARLALIRQRMSWGNVKEAATACGLPVESWRTWERDNVTPRRIVEIALIISERTGCDYGWLLTGPRLREGRLITTGSRAQETVLAPNYGLASMTSRSPLPGHPKRTSPAPATRRPARTHLGHSLIGR